VATTAQGLPFEIGGIRYSVCQTSEVPEVIEILARSFSRGDPPAVAVGLTEDDFRPYLALVTASAGRDGLTIVARDVASGDMAGAVSTEDAGSPAEVDLNALSPRFAPVYDLFGELDSAIGDVDPIEPGTTLHVFMLGVHERFAGHGIAKRLVEACLANGATLGYRRAVTEATNLVSQHIFRKHGFVTQAEATYADYRRDGVAIFESIADHGGIKAMIRQPL
jgi:ribosomal protein S18 acetylase RimI-like enzyme